MANSIQKITKKDRYAQLLEIAEVKANAELVEFINHEMELLAKKNATPSGERKPTAKQVENEGIKNEILDNMADGEKYTISNMLKEFECLFEFSSSKVNALVTQLKKEGKVTRVVEGRMVYFVKADAEVIDAE